MTENLNLLESEINYVAREYLSGKVNFEEIVTNQSKLINLKFNYLLSLNGASPKILTWEVFEKIIEITN